MNVPLYPIAFLVNLCKILYTFGDHSDRQYLVDIKMSSSKPSVPSSYARVVSSSTLKLPSNYSALCLPQISDDRSQIQHIKMGRKSLLLKKLPQPPTNNLQKCSSLSNISNLSLF